MTEEQFEREYPKDKYRYEKQRMRTKGTMQQTEIEDFDIIHIESGEVVLKATRTEHTNLKGFKTTVDWDW
ncbi:hypothetical protein [Enterobacter kobei]|uniref:hypothetical protein n=1 Tax=Enterobacter kobei TaxID=208224 RepID=UPI001E486806|nr:hypothetical protein [Enterobacter kobei]MCE1262332.1 hypothetical protein [Enterobacter kobei]MCE1361626.1 hypothetical protein [Enterobacter kobei]